MINFDAPIPMTARILSVQRPGLLNVSGKTGGVSTRESRVQRGATGAAGRFLKTGRRGRSDSYNVPSIPAPTATGG